MDWATVIASIVTGVFGVIIILMQRAQARRTHTNHGKTIGQHVEALVEDIQEAKVAARMTALELAEYKDEQRRAAREQKKLIEHYVAEDAKAHAEMRQLIIQVAQGKVVS